MDDASDREVANSGQWTCPICKAVQVPLPQCRRCRGDLRGLLALRQSIAIWALGELEQVCKAGSRQ